jgi:hypothetical protein
MSESKEKPLCIVATHPDYNAIGRQNHDRRLKAELEYDRGSKTEREWRSDPILVEKILRKQIETASNHKEGNGNIGWFISVYPPAARLM